MAYKMKGPSLYPNYGKANKAIKVNREDTTTSDHRATSSPFQNNPTVKKKKKKTKEDYLKEGFTPADADKMMASGATTGVVNREDWEPAYEGADYSQAEINKMTEKEKLAKIDGYTPPKKKNKKSKK